MILLDSNILSEVIRPSPEPVVLDWLAAQPTTSVFISAITEAELRTGVAFLPEGKRRAVLAAALAAAEQAPLLEVDFFGRILPFDSLAAIAYAEIVAIRRQNGRPISQADAQIAAIAHSRGAVLATRNIADFDRCGIEIINPWKA